MKYRIKEYQHWYGSKFHVQWQLFNLFWVGYGSSCYFNSLEEAKECIGNFKKEDDAKIVIHEVD